LARVRAVYGNGELLTLEAALVVDLLDGGDRLQRIRALATDGALCSRHVAVMTWREQGKESEIVPKK
jgi:hypothetical protein